MKSVAFLSLLAVASAASIRDHSVALKVTGGPAPAPAPAPAADKEPPTLETLRIKFEIENFNYYDLTKETCPEKVRKHHHHKKHHKAKKADKDAKKGMLPLPPLAVPEVPMPSDSPLPTLEMPGSEVPKLPWMEKGAQKDKPPPPPPPPAPTSDADPAIDAVHGATDEIADAVKSAMGPKDASLKPPWMQKPDAAPAAPSFMQVAASTQECVARQGMGETKSTECTTIMDVLRDTIKDTVQGIIKCLYLESLKPSSAASPAGGPAASLPASPAAAFLEKSPAPAPAPGPAGPPPMPDVKIFVTFSPGKKIGKGKSTIVEITFLDSAGNGVDDVSAAKPFLTWCTKNGLFNDQMEDVLEQVTHVEPEIRHEELETKKVEQWNVKKCEKHLESIVDEFSHHYTRRQVPVALYNECTNFMTRMSFSHDYVLDPQDTKRCRKATRKFATHWNKGMKLEETDFSEMCHQSCEAKYGRSAPLCNVESEKASPL